MTNADYIVVGAGSAGCVLANRLSASGRFRVLLLEAGGSDRRFWIRVPIGYGRTFYDASVNWMYLTEPDPGTAHRLSYWPRGKVLGGSSSINAMVWIRGEPRDFDDWAALGNPGWGWRDVLPYFKRLEDHALGESEYRGAGGPVHVTDVSRETHPLCQVYLEACRELGFPPSADLNGTENERAGLYCITTLNGVRVSAATAYLAPARRRPNLEVLTGAHATRVVFAGRRAIGVEYLRGGRRQRAQASREVILAAGAVGSPQLLQLSGVGPAALLREHGVELVHESPAVGGNLQDHLGLDFLFRSRRPTLNDELGPWWGKLLAGARYVLFRRGPLALSVNQGGGFVRSRPDRPHPDVQLYFSPVSYTRAPPGKRPLMSPDPFPGFLLGYSVCRPTSRGRLRIRSTDPLAAPSIHPNYLSTGEDLAAMLAASRLMRRFAATRAFSAVIEAELKPGPSVEDDEALTRDIRERGSTVFHPVGTCAMGPDPARAVVDHALRVHGIAGLRVIDASVFPCITSGNTNAPTLMVAEKGADAVLAE